MVVKGKTGSLAIIGERELVLGFRLIGIEDTFIAEGKDGAKKLMEIVRSGKYALIMVSENIRGHLEQAEMRYVDFSTFPVVVFIPMPGGKEEESVRDLAKRVLGVDIGG
ncbi:MAG TPA: V-type ATP synthase subunit F [Thermoplasmataceae archaeon]|nr:V-type ATP synthase subunit F [Thermoplasmatales archaeon AK]HLH86657.1 V-type ATP synthase subunit F [Thermoplasmataceae archaeon]